MLRSLVALLFLLWTHGAQAQGANIFTGEVTVSCGTSSTAVLPANAASQVVYIRVPSGGSNVVWFNFVGVAATAEAPNVDLSAGQTIVWAAPGFVPQGAISCISTPALQAISVLYK